VTGQGPGTERTRSEEGGDLFFHETFGGNGRTCSTCHDPRDEYALTPQLVQERYALDPSDPLFRSIDSDDETGTSYTTLLSHAVFRVTIPLHKNVSLPDHPGQRTITVWRAVPSISNAALTAPYLHDGRATTLRDQAEGAITDHMQPARQPTETELAALAAFETEQFYPLRLRSMRDRTDPVPKPPGFSIPVSSAAALRGKEVFDDHCRACHDGETMDAPGLPGARRAATVFVSETNAPGFPLQSVAFRQPDGNVLVAVTPDPGRAAITGSLRDLNSFDIPALRGIKHTAPYFHDNSVSTLGEVIDHYNDHFQFRITDEEREDLIAFLELL
jgi:cytochrome c peroxidase